MSSTTLQDELTSINAIYSPSTLTPTLTSRADSTYILRLVTQDITLRLHFPQTYPFDPPSILGPESVGASLPKGTAAHVVGVARDVLRKCHEAGSPCVYELMERLGEVLPEETSSITEENPVHEADIQPPETQEQSNFPLPHWTLSSTVTSHKSVFLARCAPITSARDASRCIQHLILHDKKVSKATHNITAYRVRQAEKPGLVWQDCDDDGEDAAGGRLLRLLQVMDVWGVVVVVSRWYGGVLLGPDRFRIINSAAREAVVKAGFGDGKEKEK